MDSERAAMMGKPHIGPLFYKSPTSRNATFLDSCLCQICGRPAIHAHHLVPKGMGGANFKIERNGLILRSPCIAVCHQCHERFHLRGVKSMWLKARWVWDRPEYAVADERGLLVPSPHSESYFNYGCYEIRNAISKIEIRG